jgi:hypothetical protein
VTRTDCAEVLSSALTTGAGPGTATDVRVLLIAEKVDGFFLERLTADGGQVRTTQHDTMDEAMQAAYAEYVLSDWRRCPDEIDPLTYIRSRPGRRPDRPEATPGDWLRSGASGSSTAPRSERTPS